MNNARLTHCDKCKSIIRDNGKCDCGWWHEKDEQPAFCKKIEESILAFNEMNKLHGMKIFSGDHHTKTNIIIFKGNFDQCIKARNFIDKMLESQYG